MNASGLGEIPLGERVTVRHRLPDGRATDSVGTLAARDSTSLTLQTRRGQVRVALDSVVVHRVVRPAPWRIGTFLRRAGVAVLDIDWTAERGIPLAGTLDLVDELVQAGIPVFVLTNGTDPVPEELDHTGPGDLVPWLLSTVDLALTTPAPEAFAAAHARIEDRLGRRVGRAEVRFTDDRPASVDAARQFGWQARIFTHPQ